MTDLPELDLRTLWHPFTQMGDWMDGRPVVIERGEGNYLIDTEGRRYLDGISSMWVNLHGHDHPRIRAAIHTQLDRLAHSTLLGLANEPSIELAARLVELAPAGLTRVFFSDNGSTAVEIALKMAFQFWQQHEDQASRARTRFVALKGAYHGDTLGAVALGGVESFHEIFRPLVFEALRAENAYCYRCPYGLRYPDCGIHCLESLEGLLERHGHEVAAVVVEPLVQAAAGILLLPDGWLKRARELCTRHGTLLIVDEVATGFGRTGRMFACEHEGVTPDLMTIAKGMSAGFLPLAATLTSEEIFEGFLGPVRDQRQFFHGHSYSGNALACAASLASLEVFEQEAVLEHVREMSEHLARRLETLRRLPAVGEIRQRGLMVGIELVQDRATREPFDAGERIGALVCMAIRKHGVILRPLGETIVLMPPLSVQRGEIEHLVDALAKCIAQVTGE
ncbi:MAG: adenosylmethionine--8-amino-7-oxononanoate transaminase [Deltaproteobacteria bacterium]|nr:MAG: adenosylmethionine--8-amino-7-oxononanoate transaminase [Deltaproteobacteria bacterium]TDJ09928.1 MAG: adenosylmethionine--8-amino-7-oxononanoate transaminase [Deltaproteobacteria bacterium]